MNTTQEVAKALWGARQSDDTFQPCNWVRVYTWRHNEAVIIITELETLNRIERRLDGWVIKGDKSWRLEALSEYQWDKIELACSKIASTQEEAQAVPKPRVELVPCACLCTQCGDMHPSMEPKKVPYCPSCEPEQCDAEEAQARADGCPCDGPANERPHADSCPQSPNYWGHHNEAVAAQAEPVWDHGRPWPKAKDVRPS
jgi:hypothetical protein